MVLAVVQLDMSYRGRGLRGRALVSHPFGSRRAETLPWKNAPTWHLPGSGAVACCERGRGRELGSRVNRRCLRVLHTPCVTANLYNRQWRQCPGGNRKRRIRSADKKETVQVVTVARSVDHGTGEGIAD